MVFRIIGKSGSTKISLSIVIVELGALGNAIAIPIQLSARDALDAGGQSDPVVSIVRPGPASWDKGQFLGSHAIGQSDGHRRFSGAGGLVQRV